MLAHSITQNNAAFLARGKMWSIAADNPNFAELCDLLRSGCLDEDRLIGMTSISQLVIKAGGGRLSMDGATLMLDGEALPAVWLASLAADQRLIHALMARKGDKVRLKGDEEAPDGIYEVMDVDNTDPNQRLYFETEEGFFGYAQSLSVKEVFHEPG